MTMGDVEALNASSFDRIAYSDVLELSVGSEAQTLVMGCVEAAGGMRRRVYSARGLGELHAVLELLQRKGELFCGSLWTLHRCPTSAQLPYTVRNPAADGDDGDDEDDSPKIQVQFCTLVDCLQPNRKLARRTLVWARDLSARAHHHQQLLFVAPDLVESAELELSKKKQKQKRVSDATLWCSGKHVVR